MTGLIKINKIDFFIEIPIKYLPESLIKEGKYGIFWSELGQYKKYLDNYLVSEFISKDILVVGTKSLGRSFSSQIVIQTPQKDFYISEHSSHNDGFDGFYTGYCVNGIFEDDSKTKETCDCGNHPFQLKLFVDYVELIYPKDDKTNINNSKELISVFFDKSEFEKKMFVTDTFKVDVDKYLATLCRENMAVDLPLLARKMTRGMDDLSIFASSSDVCTRTGLFVMPCDYYADPKQIIIAYDKAKYESAHTNSGIIPPHYKDLEISLNQLEKIRPALEEIFSRRVWSNMSIIKNELNDLNQIEYLKTLESNFMGSFTDIFVDQFNYLSQHVNSIHEKGVINMYKFDVKPSFNFWSGWDEEYYLFTIPSVKIAFIFGIETFD